MNKANSTSKKTTSRRSDSKPKNKGLSAVPTDNVVHDSPEEDILKLWSSLNVNNIEDKVPELPAYTIREMPTPVHTLTVDTLRRKIYQDIFLKYELLKGNVVTYSPLWETFPFSIEATVIKENSISSTGNIINFRKQCRQLYGELSKSQQQKLQKLGVFADWTSAEKTMEARYETKLFSYFDRLRDAKYLRDELKLSHWCPKCVSPLETDKTVTNVTNSVLDTYVKYPFNDGFEEFGKDVYFTIRFPASHLWEVAGTNAIGIYEKVDFWLTEFENQYLIFSEPQLNKYVDPNAKRKNYPKRIAKLKPAMLKDCSVSHPLFSLSSLPFFIIPEKVVEKIGDSSEKNELNAGIIPLNPAHHSLSYSIFNMLPYMTNLTDTQQISSTPTSPIFDETGRFTEDADTLCGLNITNAIQFITDELESRDCIIKARKHRIKQLECQLCNGLSVSRPYRHWMFSMDSSEIIGEVINSEEYWEHYDENIRDDIHHQVISVGDMPISSQRQWGIPLPVLRCDNCNSLITDKKILRAVRSSIRRGSEHWFRLSVEELLPADTVCMNCHSKDFRKESTCIESHFANLLQTLDTSDFKKSTSETTTNIAFVPRNSFLQWLGELSVLSASLQLSRPTKESQPFKFLKLNNIPEEVWETEIQDNILHNYPADLLRLISIVPDLHQVEIRGNGTKQLNLLIEQYNDKYQTIKDTISKASELLINLQVKDKTDTTKPKSKGLNKDDFNKMGHSDVIVVSLTQQLMVQVDAAFENKDYFQVWELLSDFCNTELLFYLNICPTEVTKKGLVSSQIVLLSIIQVILERLAPILPFLAEEYYTNIFASTDSIFQNQLSQLPENPDQLDVQTEWESIKDEYQSAT